MAQQLQLVFQNDENWTKKLELLNDGRAKHKIVKQN